MRHLSPGCRLVEDSLLLAASLFPPLNLDTLWPQCLAWKKVLPRAQWMLSVATTTWHSTIQPPALLCCDRPSQSCCACGRCHCSPLLSRVSPLLFLFAGRLSPPLFFTQDFLLTSISGEGIGYPLQYFWGFPCGSAGKESAYNAGDLGSISGLGRSPGERKGFPL